jgi:hypothetical protein
VEFLSTKIDLVIVLLGGMHFFNMRMLVRFRARAARSKSSTCGRVKLLQVMRQDG